MEDESMTNSQSSHEMLKDIYKDTDKILNHMKGNKMSDNALGYLMGANANRGYDAAAMAYNNPWMYLIMLAMFGNGGWGGWGNNRGAVTSAVDTNMLMNMIQNVGATSQRDFDRMATNFGVTNSQLANGIAAINNSVQQVACQVGTSAQQVINAIQNGDAGIMQAVQNSCCENRLAICQQTNALQQGQWQLGVTMQQQGDMTRSLIREQSFEAQIRALTQENSQLRDAAQTAKLENDISVGNAAIMNQLTAMQTLLQNQITAQGYQIQALSAKSATTGA